jgi:hypothetical protein
VERVEEIVENEENDDVNISTPHIYFLVSRRLDRG